MRRLQLFEISDLAWCPATIREGVTSFLAWLCQTMGIYDPALRVLEEVIEETGVRVVVDLCGGSGGPWIGWQQDGKIPKQLERVLLTDLTPPRWELAATPPLSVERRSVDVMAPPALPAGIRTMFTAAHHFRPADLRAILTRIVEQDQPVVIFEMTERSGRALVSMMPAGLAAWVYGWRERRGELQGLLWFLLFPVVPFVVWFDAIVSCFRSYKPEELVGMARPLNDRYSWRAGTVRGRRWAVAITYLIGTPDRGESATRSVSIPLRRT